MGITVLGPLTVDGSGRLSPRDRVVLAGTGDARRSPRQRRPARRRAVGRPATRVGGQDPAGLHRPAAQGARARRRSRPHPRDTRLTLPADEVDAGAVRARWSSAVARAADARRGGPRRLPADRGARAVAREPRSPSWRTGSRGRRGRRLDELRLEAEELRVDAHLRSGRHREVLARGAGDGARRPRCASGAGRCSRWRSTRPAARARRCARSTGSSPCSLSSSASTPAPTWSRSSRRSCGRTRRCCPAAPAAPAGSSCPYQGLRPYDVADAETLLRS